MDNFSTDGTREFLKEWVADGYKGVKDRVHIGLALNLRLQQELPRWIIESMKSLSPIVEEIIQRRRRSIGSMD